jgi:thiamine pyrophosphokinase
VRALIVADGSPPTRAALDASWPGWADEIGLVVAADGGALVAAALDLVPDLVVGDGDSLGADGIASLRATGVDVVLARPDKDESDTELAMLAAAARGATSLTVLAAFGGRLDHALANIWLLALPALAARSVELIDGQSRVSLVSAEAGTPVRRLLPPGRAGDLVSLLPLGPDVTGVTTEGLRYPLRDEALPLGPSRGLSNVRVGESEVSVTVGRGRLLVVETPATLGR